MTEKGSLNRRQRAFVAALVGAPTILQAAEVAGISESTAYRYLKQPAVRAALGLALDTALGQVVRRSVAAMTEALDTLEAIHLDQEQPAGSRVAAARTIFTEGPKLRESLDLAERVAALEERG